MYLARKFRQAIFWLERAVKLGLGDIHLTIAEIYLRNERTRKKAVYHLERACKSRCITEGSREEAKSLLKACIWRDRQKFKRAITWFQRAVKLGSGDSNLDIAEIYFRNERNQGKAIYYLEQACKSRCITQGSRQEARSLLKPLKKA